MAIFRRRICRWIGCAGKRNIRIAASRAGKVRSGAVPGVQKLSFFWRQRALPRQRHRKRFRLMGNRDHAFSRAGRPRRTQRLHRGRQPGVRILYLSWAASAFFYQPYGIARYTRRAGYFRPAHFCPVVPRQTSPERHLCVLDANWYRH